MKRLFAAIATLLMALFIAMPAQAQTAPEVPNCFPTISGSDMHGPHIHYGRHGFHFAWACRGSPTLPLRAWAVSCRHETCLYEAWSAMVREVTANSGAGIANRNMIARRAWTANVLVNCPELNTVPADQVGQAERADWLMCAEQRHFTDAVFPPVQ